MNRSGAGSKRYRLLGACGLMVLGACGQEVGEQSVGDPVRSASQALDSGIDGGATLAVLNELDVNPPTGGDGDYEYVELKGTPGGLLTNVHVVALDGDISDAGEVDFVVNLGTACGGNACAFGSNGLLVLRDSATGGHALPAETTVVASGVELENGSISVLLVLSSTPLGDTDLDDDDDGTLELPAGVTVIDAVGWSDGDAPDHVYGGVDVTPQEAGGDEYAPDGVTRFPTSTAELSAAAWYVGDISGGVISSTTYDPAQSSSNMPAGAVLTPGASNYPTAADDAGTDAASDTGTEPDAGTDAALDTGTDTGPETGSDAQADAAVDVATEAAPDTGTEAGPDTGTEAGPDTGTEAGPDTGTGGTSGSGGSGGSAGTTGGSAGAGGTAGSAGLGGRGGTAGTTGGSAGAGGTAGAAGAAGRAGSAGSAGRPAAPRPVLEEDDGCGCEIPDSGRGGSLWLMGALALLAGLRRRRFY